MIKPNKTFLIIGLLCTLLAFNAEPMKAGVLDWLLDDVNQESSCGQLGEQSTIHTMGDQGQTEKPKPAAPKRSIWDIIKDIFT